MLANYFRQSHLLRSSDGVPVKVATKDKGLLFILAFVQWHRSENTTRDGGQDLSVQLYCQHPYLQTG
jgi:hypothetical protein